jgi:glycosyl transferase, family 25
MRIYVLNLARAADRRAHIERAATAAGVTLDFIEAVDGRTLTDAQRDVVDHRRRRRITPYLLSDNEIGCWLSHRRAMRALVESGKAMAAILEDDVTLLPDFPRVLDALQHQGGLFDVVTLYRNFQRDPAFETCRSLTRGVSLGRVAPMQTGAVGYVITRHAAKKFLAATPRYVHAVDKEMHRYWASGLDIYALSQPVVIHDDAGHSCLSETRLDHRPKDRVKYPDADAVYWRLQQFGHRAADSVLKRAAFPAYVRLGCNQDWEARLGKMRRLQVALREILQPPPAWSR